MVVGPNGAVIPGVAKHVEEVRRRREEPAPTLPLRTEVKDALGIAHTQRNAILKVVEAHVATKTAIVRDGDNIALVITETT